TWQQVNVHMYQGDAPAPGQGGRLSADLIHEVTLEPGLRPSIAVEAAMRFQEKRQRLAPGYAPDSAEEFLDWLKERLVLPWPAWQELLQAAKRDRKLDTEILTRSLVEKVVLLHPDGGKDTILVAARELLPALWEGLYRPLRATLEITLLDGAPLPAEERPKKRSYGADRPLSLAAEQLGQWLRFFGPRPPAAIAAELGLPLSALTPLIEELAGAQIIVVGPLLKGGAPEEICDQENFELLLRLARKAAQPVIEARPIEQLALFLAQHQGLTQPAGRDDLAARLNQLLCWTAPAALWESEILPVRLRDYHPDWLDALLQTHDLRWIGREGQKVLFCFEEELDLIQAEEKLDVAGDTGSADDLSRLFPDSDGRYPFSALERMAQGKSAALHDRLWQWVWRGEVSNDSFAALRRGVENHFRMPELPKAAPAGGRMHRPGRSVFQRWRGARPGIGNWFRLTAPEVVEDLLEREERNKDRVRLLLERYGILFRELLARELPMLRWSFLFRSLRLMELSGEVLSGHFFEGIDGLQFVSAQELPRLGQALPTDAIFWINAVDPAALCGLELDPLRGRLPRRLPGVHIVYHGERPVVFSHGMGARLEILVSADHPRLGDYFGFFDHLLCRRVMPLRNIRIRQINACPAAKQTAYVAVLGKLFEMIVDPKEVTLYRRRAG
ncbi:MAG: hypothetical protein WAU91_07945, partial [Desulfatitalea sp.]